MDITYVIRPECLWYADGVPRQWHDIFNKSDMIRGKFIFVAPTILKEILMTKKGSTNGRNNANDGRATWININITDDHENEILRWNPDDPTLFAGLCEMVVTGHSIGWKTANDGDGFMAYATGTSDDCPNRGKGLSAFAGTPRDAVICLLYKHLAIAERSWPTSATTEGRKFR